VTTGPDNPMSMKRPGRRAPVAPVFPSPPLKFRTSGFPQYGFKLDVEHDLRPEGLIRAPSRVLVPCGPCGQAIGFGPHGAPVQRPFARRRVMLSHPLKRYYGLIRATRDLLPTYVFVRQVFASRPATRGSPLYSARVCQRATFRTPADRAAALGCSLAARTSLRLLHTGSASACPRTPVPARSCLEAAKFASCCGPLACSPCTGQDFYSRAFTSGVTPLRCRV
jgi:hypothetical protein